MEGMGTRGCLHSNVRDGWSCFPLKKLLYAVVFVVIIRIKQCQRRAFWRENRMCVQELFLYQNHVDSHHFVPPRCLSRFITVV